MKSNYDVIGVSSDKEKLVKVGEKQGVRVYCVELTRQITPLKDKLVNAISGH